jgi:hypothetical protein
LALAVALLVNARETAAARPEAANAAHLKTREERLVDGSISSGQPLSTPASLVMLSASGVLQLTRHASAAVAALVAPSPSPAQTPSALLDVTDAVPNGADDATADDQISCGAFGVLNNKMTVVDLDEDGGCVAGQDSSSVFVHFVGGSSLECQPPEPVQGCHRYVIARYSQSCDLAPLKTFRLTRNSELFKDGVYKECYEAPFLESREVYTKGAPGIDRCDWEYCENLAVLPQEAKARSWCATSLALCIVMRFMVAALRQDP